MSEKPIIFSGPMVRAIIEDRKSVTRRVVNPQPAEIAGLYFRHCGNGLWAGYMPPGEPAAIPEIRAPYRRGDTLWVRETFANIALKGYPPTWFYRADGDELPPADARAADNRWRPSIHMPRAASRIRLRVADVRVERLQAITDDSIVSEGIEPVYGPGRYCSWLDPWRDLWDSLNAKRGYGWETNPWVWVVEFGKLYEGGTER